MSAPAQRGGVSSARMGEWLHSHDTGMSSEAIFHYMALGVKGGAVPSDTADLGRCVRLLDRFPEWAARVSELACISDDWAALSSIWEDLVTAYRGDLSKRAEGAEWVSDKMLNELWWEKTPHGLWTHRDHGFTAQGATP